MRLLVEIDLGAGRIPGHEDDEVARILRQLAGSVKQRPLTTGFDEELYDSGYSAVGRWRLED
jgi:hypothetical protein